MPYEQHVLDHYSKPYHKGPFPDSRYSNQLGSARSEVCGDLVQIEASVEDGILTEIWWKGEGCCFSQAAASMLVEFARGKTVDKMISFSAEELFDLFQAEIPIARCSCVLVSLEALQNLLEDC